MRIKGVTTIVIKQFFLSLCGMGLGVGVALADTDDRLRRLEQLIENNRIGNFDDYWLAKKIFTGDFTKVALVFGYVDNKAICKMMAEHLRSSYTSAEYICFRANSKLEPRPGG